MLLRKHLFTPGPTNMPEAIRRACDRPLEDHRAPDFPELVKPIFDDLKRVFRTETGEVLVFAGSGTLGWEAALTNTLSPGDKILTASYGHFSDLWIRMCRDFGFEVEVIDGIWGEGAPVDDYAARLAADKNHEIKAILACHNETATGVTSDIGALRKAIDATGHPALLMVDGVSSIASLEFRMDDWGVDVAVCGSQKGFMLPTGLAIVGVSQKALAAAGAAKCGRNFVDFKAMLKSNQTGYFPYTPAVTLLHGLKESCRILLEEGLDNVHARHHRLGEGVRQAVTAWGLTTCSKERRWHSDTVTAIVVPEGADSAAVVKAAYNNYHLSLGGGLSKVAGKVFRIGHMGAVDDIMMLSAIAGAEMAMADAGIRLDLGSGVAAAQAYYRETR